MILLEHSLGIVMLAIVLFISTNTDDLMLLIAIFGYPGTSRREVVVGQCLGMTVLFLVSAAAAKLALALPTQWIPLLGVVPILIAVNWIVRGNPRISKIQTINWWSVAMATVGSGGDNLAVYTPAFAFQRNSVVASMGALFVLFTLILCRVAHCVARHPLLEVQMSKLSRIVAPIVLILVGLWTIGKNPAIRALCGRVFSTL